MLMNSKKKSRLIFLAVVLILISLIVILFGNAIYNILREKYLYSNYPEQYPMWEQEA